MYSCAQMDVPRWIHLAAGQIHPATRQIHPVPRWIFIFSYCLLSCSILHSCSWMDVFGHRMDTFCAQMVPCCTQTVIRIHCLPSIFVLCFYIVSVYLYSLISCHPIVPSLLYHFIPICVFCKCLSLAFASSIVSVSSLIQALSSILYIAFMVQHV